MQPISHGTRAALVRDGGRRENRQAVPHAWHSGVLAGQGRCPAQAAQYPVEIGCHAAWPAPSPLHIITTCNQVRKGVSAIEKREIRFVPRAVCFE
ncbi:hypothetical protein SDC9_54890 [bioreactor metagenome]|uniref:Uncharacterized protein n=1 Tax=bioreactor metagenome TaxID=1076179 RepID=A0A644WXZ4_9ZZZZ